MPSSCVLSRFTRRTATVTISAPAASMERTMLSLSRYLPVPRIRRERNVRPAMTSGWSCTSVSTVVVISTASNKMHELEHITTLHGHAGEFSSVQDCAVVLDHYQLRIELQLGQQIGNSAAGSECALIAVDRDADRCR